MDDQKLHQAKRKVALLAIERFLRVCSNYESETCLRHYREISTALQAGRDEDAIRIEKLIRGTNSGDVFKWVASKTLAESVRKSISLLRTHIMYGDCRPPLVLDPNDPDIEAMGTKKMQDEQRLADQFPVVGLPEDELVAALRVIGSLERLKKRTNYRNHIQMSADPRARKAS